MTIHSGQCYRLIAKCDVWERQECAKRFGAQNHTGHSHRRNARNCRRSTVRVPLPQGCGQRATPSRKPKKRAPRCVTSMVRPGRRLARDEFSSGFPSNACWVDTRTAQTGALTHRRSNRATSAPIERTSPPVKTEAWTDSPRIQSETAQKVTAQQISRDGLLAESHPQLVVAKLFVTQTHTVKSRHQRCTRARAISLHDAALKLQPDATRDLAVEGRELGTRVQVALNLELAVGAQRVCVIEVG